MGGKLIETKDRRVPGADGSTVSVGEDEKFWR